MVWFQTASESLCPALERPWLLGRLLGRRSCRAGALRGCSSPVLGQSGRAGCKAQARHWQTGLGGGQAG